MKMLRSILAASLLVPGLLVAASIRDDAKLFSKEAIAKAEDQLKVIQKNHNREVFVETFAKAENLEAAKKDKAKYFSQWAVERYKDLKVEGVYILICNEPNYIQVVAGKSTEQRGITAEKRTAIRKALTEQFTKKDNPQRFDEGLLAAVAVINDSLKKGGGPGAGSGSGASAAPVSSGAEAVPELPAWTSYLCIGLMGLMAAWLVIGLIRAFSGAGGGAAGQPGAAGGGGFLTSLLGGLVGAAAGMYLYNSFFGSGASSAWGGSNDPSAPGADDNTPMTEGGGGWDDTRRDEGGWDDGGGGDWGDGGGGDW
jgi:uncharacterized protein